jgi:hypothetical protein
MFDIGADVIHPAPGSDGKPSFTALVGNVDSDTAKYIADSRVQTSRQEMISDLYDMSKVRTAKFARIINDILFAACSQHVHAVQGQS